MNAIEPTLVWWTCGTCDKRLQTEVQYEPTDDDVLVIATRMAEAHKAEGCDRRSFVFHLRKTR